jgi:hypothetical protein
MARAVTWSAVFHGGSSSYDLNNSVKSTWNNEQCTEGKGVFPEIVINILNEICVVGK